MTYQIVYLVGDFGRMTHGGEAGVGSVKIEPSRPFVHTDDHLTLFGGGTHHLSRGILAAPLAASDDATLSGIVQYTITVNLGGHADGVTTIGPVVTSINFADANQRLILDPETNEVLETRWEVEFDSIVPELPVEYTPVAAERTDMISRDLATLQASKDYTDAEVDQLRLDFENEGGGAPSVHDHDDRYYTETESDARFAAASQGAKADTAVQPAALVNKADLVDGVVPSSQLPSYVDDVVEFANLGAFPATGEPGKIYTALDTNKTYRWGGSTYVALNEGLALGETSATAYRGDRGKTAYEHSQVTSGNPHGTTAAQIGAAPSSHTHPATGISDSSSVGRAVLTATDQAGARSAIGAGTSNLALGTTSSTAKAGNYTPPVADLPAGTTLTVYKPSGGSWPARPTDRADLTVLWVGAAPAPSVVTSGTGGMRDNIDLHVVL